MNKSFAWKSGYKTALEYGELLNNPYSKDTTEYKEWRQGFKAAKKEIDKAY